MARTRRSRKSITETVLLAVLVVTSVLLWKLYVIQVGFIPTRTGAVCWLSGSRIKKLFVKLEVARKKPVTGSNTTAVGSWTPAMRAVTLGVAWLRSIRFRSFCVAL